MINKVSHLLGKSISSKILVIGTGRSGTHWLARILHRHQSVRATIEENPGFRWVTEMAVDPSTRDTNYQKLVWYYRWQHLRSVPQNYLDKSHPNLWIADLLAETFEDMLFLGIQRNPYATVASMLNHEGVQKWHKNWRKYPVPNPFLGIQKDDIERYDDLSLTTQCAMRWRAHYDKINKVNKYLGDRMMTVHHEDLIENTQSILEEIQKFIGLNRIPKPRIDFETLDKWKSQLTDKQIKDVESVSKIKPHEVTTTSDIKK